MRLTKLGECGADVVQGPVGHAEAVEEALVNVHQLLQHPVAVPRLDLAVQRLQGGEERVADPVDGLEDVPDDLGVGLVLGLDPGHQGLGVALDVCVDQEDPQPLLGLDGMKGSFKKETC